MEREERLKAAIKAAATARGIELTEEQSKKLVEIVDGVIGKFPFKGEVNLLNDIFNP